MKYYTVVLQADEPECLEAARVMSAYLAERLDMVVTLSVSENQLSSIAKARIDEMANERALSIARKMGE